MENLRFTFSEVLALFGVFQCVYVIVYVGFRTHKIVNVLLPALYFLILGSAFFMEVGDRTLSSAFAHYGVIKWGLWTVGTPLSVLLIIQISQTHCLPRFVNWLILLLVPVAYLVSRGLFYAMEFDECDAAHGCAMFQEILWMSGSFVGALSLLFIWIKRNVFEDILKQKAGKERYWLILSFVIINIAYLGLSLFSISGDLALQIPIARTILGLGFVYIISTSLFRIYPSAFLIVNRGDVARNVLNDDEKEVGARIESLLKLEKIYHEATYSRSDLAQELGVPEATVSRVINMYFNRSFPQLLNEYRVEDSKRLLLETDASIKTVAEEVGFNSLPSFNRVFRDIAGQSPSSYRKNMIK